LQEEVNLAQKKVDKIALYNVQWERLKRIENLERARFNAGRVPAQGLLQIRTDLHVVESQLEREKEALLRTAKRSREPLEKVYKDIAESVKGHTNNDGIQEAGIGEIG